MNCLRHYYNSLLKEEGYIKIFHVLLPLFFLGLTSLVTLSGMRLQILPSLFIITPIVFLITFVSTDMALVLLIFSMLLSPEFKIADITSRNVVIRLDDMLILIVFLTWLAKMAINKELGLLRSTPINKLIISYIFICILSTGIGIIMGNILSLRSLFYILKYVEYFMIYFLITNNIRDKEQIQMFMSVFLITGLIVCIYAFSQIAILDRTTAPFEGEHPEPNTLGGYFLLLFSVSMGLFLYNRSRNWKIFLGFLMLFIIPSFIYTLSRSSYVSFIIMYIAIIFLTEKKKFFLSVILVAAICILVFVFPQVTNVITQRIESTFIRAGKVYEPFGKTINIEHSASVRIEGWRIISQQWLKRPFLGYGVTGVGLVDIQYPLILGETGIIGFSIFLLLLREIFRRSLRVYKDLEDGWEKGLALGFLGGFIGLIFHGFGANTFIIVRIMEPFWFLTAIVIMLPSIEGVKTQNV